MLIGKKTEQVCLKAQRSYRCAYRQKDPTDVLLGKRPIKCAYRLKDPINVLTGEKDPTDVLKGRKAQKMCL